MQGKRKTNGHTCGQMTLVDYMGRTIRLNEERYSHILEHPEMLDQLGQITETLFAPDFVVSTSADPSVYVYHRYYLQTPVTRKYMLVAVKITPNDAFVLTVFFSSRRKKGTTVWQR
jgi:hypothetical protein